MSQTENRILRNLQQPHLVIVEEIETTDERVKALLNMKRQVVAAGQHWIHVTADRNACPVFDGDTRIAIREEQ